MRIFVRIDGRKLEFDAGARDAAGSLPLSCLWAQEDDPVEPTCEQHSSDEVEVALRPDAPSVFVSLDQERIDALRKGEEILLKVAGHEMALRVSEAKAHARTAAPLPDRSPGPAGGAGPGTSERGKITGGVYPPMPGSIVEILVSEGDQVDAGQVLLLLEAMKMQNEVRAPLAGMIRDLRVAAGQKVDKDTLMMVVRGA